MVMNSGTRPDGQVFASEAPGGEMEAFPAETRGWGVTVDGKNSAGSVVTDPTDGIPPMEWMNWILNKISSQVLWNFQHSIPDWSAGMWSLGAFVTHSGYVWFNNFADMSNEPGIGDYWTKLFPLSGLGSIATYNVQPAPDDPESGTVPLNGGDVFIHNLLLDDGSGIPDNAVKVHVANAFDDEGNPLPLVTFDSNINTAAGKEVWEQGKRVYSPNNEPAYPVTSVNNKTGAVTLTASDVNALPDTYTPPPPDLSGYITSAVAYSTFVQGFRMANYGTHGSEGVRDSSHTALTGIYATNGWDNPTTQEVRTPQFNINGSWYDAAYI